MPKPIIVSNTSPISELAKIGQLEILEQLYGRVCIPQEVFEELANGDHPARTLVLSLRWIHTHKIGNPEEMQSLFLSTGLHSGECAAIVLAEELSANRLLIDDLAARIEAKARNVPIIGTLGILVVAKKRAIVPSIRDLIDELRRNGTRISQRLYLDILTVAGEND
jgi:predicted nucleic acid-binding protein